MRTETERRRFRMWWQRPRTHYDTIPKEAEKPILQLARRFPGLSQNGLQDEVERLGFNPDPHELKLFLREHGRRIRFPNVRRRGQWDTGWPYWANTNPAGEMDWPDREPFEYRFPYWGWMFKQPLWVRAFLLFVGLVVVLAGYVHFF